ncbi:1-phosphofructokinase family hexose kinase [Reyranella sp.]|uniref:1-phosphofructokinase family hexose kinase n=1 Tax=Reyranella sp. TaxID=1929291 RepID=UPI003D14FB11
MTSSRIVTLTVNPALDLAAEAASVRPVHKIRTFGEHYDAGGGGINVARVVHALGGDTLALFAAGGATGRMIEEMLSEAGVPWQCVPVAGTTRISLTVREQESGLEYRFVPQGPAFNVADGDRILATLAGLEAKWVVASGSLPPGLATDFYARAAHIASARGARFALDTSGAALKASLGQGIDLLKLSLGELESIAGQEVRAPEVQAQQAQGMVRAGRARMIALTLGRDGALLATADRVMRAPAIPVTEHSTVGAGDSFLAGLILGLVQGLSDRDSLRLALAAAAAAVASEGTARISRSKVDALVVQCPA